MTTCDATAPSNAILDVHELVSVYGSGSETFRAVDKVSLSIGKGEALALVGESGCGKTAMALSIGRLLPSGGRIESGRVLFENQDLAGLSERALQKIRGSKIGFVFQDPMNSLNPGLTVGYQLREPLLAHLGITDTEAKARAKELITAVGIPDAAARMTDYPYQFSGGMRQRIMIAMALSCHPKLIVADEPTTALDVSTQLQILALMKSLITELGSSLLLITHDIAAASSVCGRIAVMYAGRIVETGEAATVLGQPKMPYTQGLLESLPTLSTDIDLPVPTIPGRPPDLAHPPHGCRFRTRCPTAREVCGESEPALTPRSTGQFARCFATEPGGWQES
jgi:oligopeptide/dipeptide ABC transporter ATP-binding protein